MPCLRVGLFDGERFGSFGGDKGVHVEAWRIGLHRNAVEVNGKFAVG